MKTMILICGLLVAVSSFAKLPAPSEEAKAKAAAAKDKTAWSGKVAAYQLCKSQDKVAAHYLKAKDAAAPSTATALPACVDPGPYVPTPPAVAAAPAAAPVTPAATIGSAASVKK